MTSTPAWAYLSDDGTGEEGTALSRESLAARARQALLDLIDDEGLGEGDTLPATGALAERFGVSRTVVREALSALAALGIIEITNGRSASVRAQDHSLIRFSLARALRESPGGGFTALMDLRAPLEARAARLAAVSLASDERSADRQGLADLLRGMGGALEDSERYPQLDLRLHGEITRLSGNLALQGVLDAVRTPLFRAMQDLRATRDTRGLVGAEHSEHVRIVEAILAGDAHGAETAMAEHMESVASLDAPTAPEHPHPG